MVVQVTIQFPNPSKNSGCVPLAKSLTLCSAVFRRRPGVCLHVVPLTLQPHVHSPKTTQSRWGSDAHVRLPLHHKTTHRLTIRSVRATVTYCAVGLVDHRLDDSSPGVDKPVVDLQDGESSVLGQLPLLFLRRVRVLRDTFLRLHLTFYF